MTTLWRKALFLILLLVIWETAYRTMHWGWRFPSALQTMQTFYDGIADGQLLEATLSSLRRILIAFVLSCVIGMTLGVLFARSRLLDETFGFVVRLFYQVMIPAAIPQLITGMRMAWAFAWRALVSGELIARGIGLGQLLEEGRSLGDTSLMLCIVLVIAILGTISDHLVFKRIEDRIWTQYGLNAAKT
ncbi:ABC transporter permease [Paenibacillus sp. MCAF20]